MGNLIFGLIAKEKQKQGKIERSKKKKGKDQKVN